MGFFDSSSTSANTYNQDTRVAQEKGTATSSAVGGKRNTVTINTLDGGIVEKALDTVQLSDALGADGFNRLLSAAEKLFEQGGTVIGQTQTALADAYGKAATENKSTIDNRTLIVLAVAAAAVGIFIIRKK